MIYILSALICQFPNNSQSTVDYKPDYMPCDRTLQNAALAVSFPIFPSKFKFPFHYPKVPLELRASPSFGMLPTPLVMLGGHETIPSSADKPFV